MVRDWKFLVGMVLLATVCGCGEKKPATVPEQQDEIAAEIEKWGGSPIQDANAPGRPVTGVEFVGIRLKADQVVRLAELPQLADLVLNDTGLTDEMLASLSGLQYIERLDLSENPISDASTNVIAEMPRLRELRICGTKITDATLDHVAQCKDLRLLSIERTKVTNAGLQKLASLKSLRMIEAYDTPIKKEEATSLEDTVNANRRDKDKHLIVVVGKSDSSVDDYVEVSVEEPSSDSEQ